MSLLPPPKPPAKKGVYIYAAVDIRQDPPEIVHLEKTRRAAQEKRKWSKDADHLRVKRGRLFLYES